ncbi:hypothetical protein J9303_13370, partial [Bacillaceae bacterium Marseille-Q3522]|nr:hypothetical protein [Bacillaceae bacterium Marseille-Q3522]
QILASSIFFSVAAHFLYAFAFILSKGKGLKTVAYSIMTLASVGVIAVIVYAYNYKSYLVNQNAFFDVIFYLLFQYPKYLLNTSITLLDAGLFTVLIMINALCFIPFAYWLTNYCYKRGLLTISLRDLDQSFYSDKISSFLHKYVKNFFIRKDLLYLVRTPKLLSVYVSPILFTSLIENKNQFASSSLTLTFLINVFALIITTVTLHILLSDDKNNQDLLYSIPFDHKELFKMRSHLLHILSFIIAGSFLLIVCMLESVNRISVIYGIGQLLILTYISSRILLARIMKRSTKDARGYRYNGQMVRPLFYYIFVWNIPLLIIFSILHEYFIRFMNNSTLSMQAHIIFVLMAVIVIGMLLKSIKIKINDEVK